MNRNVYRIRYVLYYFTAHSYILLKDIVRSAHLIEYVYNKWHEISRKKSQRKTQRH